MNMKKRAAQFMRTMVVLFAAQLILSAPSFAQTADSSFSQTTDSLYIGDVGDNTVKRFGLKGQSLGTFVKSTSDLRGPRGLVFNQVGNLILSNQNVNTTDNSDILEYDRTGQPLPPLVPHTDANAPAASRGVILWRDTKAKQDFMFVADFTTEPDPNKPQTPGRLLKYTADGHFAGSFVPDLSFGTCALPPTNDRANGEFHPRGIVLGSDGLLYISNYPCLVSGLRGQVIRFDPQNGRFKDVFIDDQGLNRPEGLAFGPDGNLYVTSFRSNETPTTIDNDKILVFQGPKCGSPGTYVDKIEFYRATTRDQPRAYAQALLFGPGGKLFVPISGNSSDTGSVRRYNVSSKHFDVFVPTGTLQAGWYLTFGQTNPSTLAYGSD
ncbi:hypothetical protein OKW45_007227 [Paraburkholderia sp. WSM4175]|uniref:hypothetical protein n=1 Tax=Paraburkholderia sp. WSM4175 TaxID=2991072 RepID=UPI003D1C0F96